MSTGRLPKCAIGDDEPLLARSPRRPRRTGSARARRSRAKRSRSAGANREHVALLRLVAPDLARRHARLFGRHRAQVEARRRRRRHAPAPAARSTARRRRRRGSTGSGSPSPSCQQRSMTSCARRWISALPRCTESKSRSAVLAPVAIDDAAPPPRPISMPGPPSWISSAPSASGSLCACVGADVADAAGDHDRLVVAAHLAARPPARRCGSSRRGSGRPNSLLNAAPPIGPSSMIVERRGDALGLAVAALSHGCGERRACAGATPRSR